MEGDSTAAELANVLQADYYRSLLETERDVLRRQLAKQENRLARCVAGGSAMRAGVPRARAAVRDLEREIDTIGWMITALERRFPKHADLGA